MRLLRLLWSAFDYLDSPPGGLFIHCPITTDPRLYIYRALGLIYNDRIILPPGPLPFRFYPVDIDLITCEALRTPVGFGSADSPVHDAQDVQTRLARLLDSFIQYLQADPFQLDIQLNGRYPDLCPGYLKSISP
jgi:hypothetical protein